VVVRVARAAAVPALDHPAATARSGLRLVGDEARLQDLLDAGHVRPATALHAVRPPAAEEPGRVGVDAAWPVPAALRPLLPTGALRRGSTAAVLGSTSVLFATLATASEAGAWITLIGMPEAGLLAATEYGIDLDRLPLIPDSGPHWQQVVAAMLDGTDVVVVKPPTPVTAADTRHLAARVRQRGTALLSTTPWPGAEATLEATDSCWYGLGYGRGRLRARQMQAVAYGPGRLARPRQARLWLPAPDGQPIAAPPITAAADRVAS
jgi:hypothetical protein